MVAVVFLIAIWLLLTEELTLLNLAIGTVFGCATMFFVHKFLPLKTLSKIKMHKLITFPFYLLAQIYIAGFHIIKIIFTGSKVSIITLETKIKDDSLKVMLVDAITLTPGSVLLNLNGNKVTLLWIRGKNEPSDLEYAEKQLMSRLEQRLLKAQK